jgi:transposase
MARVTAARRMYSPTAVRPMPSDTAITRSLIRYAKIHGTKHRPWLTALLARKPTKVAAIALANKLARMAWAMMVRGERYKNPVALAA